MGKSSKIKVAIISGCFILGAAVITGMLMKSDSKIPTVATEDVKGSTFASIVNSDNITINMAVTDTPTKKVIKELEDKLSNTDAKVELTNKELLLLSQALKDLDEKTSTIEILPDGRTQFGGYVSGEPSKVIGEHNASSKAFNLGDYVASLQHSQNAIKLYNDANKMISGSVIMTSGLSLKALAKIYMLAGISAQRLDKKDLAYQYAKESVEYESNLENNGLLATSLATLERYAEAMNCVEEALKFKPTDQQLLELKERILPYMQDALNVIENK